MAGGRYEYGKASQRERDRKEELFSGQVCVVRCAHCAWSFEGLAQEGRTEFKAHVLASHPHVVTKRKKTRRK